MIDKKIMDALVCCLQDDASLCCNECPIRETNICNEGTSEISTGLVNVVLDIINNQKEEIYKLQHKIASCNSEIDRLLASVDESALQSGDVHFVALYNAIDEVAKELAE